MLPEVLWLHRRAPIPDVLDQRALPRGPAKEAEVREEALQRLREIDEQGLCRDRSRYAAYMGALSRRLPGRSQTSIYLIPPQADRRARETAAAARGPSRGQERRQRGR